MVPDAGRQAGGDPLAASPRSRTAGRWSVFTPETGRTHQIRVHAARRASASRSPATRSTAPAAGRCCFTRCRCGSSASGKAAGRGDRAAAADLRQCRIRRCRALSLRDPRGGARAKASSPRAGPAARTSTRWRPRCSCAATCSGSAWRRDVYERLKELAGSRMTGAGEIVITARSYRTQEANREDARQRLAEAGRQGPHPRKRQADQDQAQPAPPRRSGSRRRRPRARIKQARAARLD